MRFRGLFKGKLDFVFPDVRIRMHKRFREIAHNDRSKISSNYVFEYGFYYKLLHLWSTFESFITFFIKSSTALGLIIITFVTS